MRTWPPALLIVLLTACSSGFRQGDADYDSLARTMEVALKDCHTRDDAERLLRKQDIAYTYGEAAFTVDAPRMVQGNKVLQRYDGKSVIYCVWVYLDANDHVLRFTQQKAYTGYP